MAALNLAQQAKRSILIASQHLEGHLYDNPEFASALSETARHSRYSEVRILIYNSKQIVQDGHCLLLLHQQLPSSVKIRKSSQEHESLQKSLLIADDCGVLEMAADDSYEGIVNFNTPVRARELSRYFNALWNVSLADPELRRLSL